MGPVRRIEPRRPKCRYPWRLPFLPTRHHLHNNCQVTLHARAKNASNVPLCVIHVVNARGKVQRFAMDSLRCDHKFGSHAINGCRTCVFDVSTELCQYAADSACTYVSRRHKMLIHLTPARRDAFGLSRNGLGCIGVLSPTRPHFSRAHPAE